MQLILGKRTLVIVPDGVLWEMPFQALDRNGRYLLEDHVVLYAPSLAVLEAMGRTATTRIVAPRILAVGNPELDRSVPADRPSRGGYAVLSDAEREVQMLGTLYGPQRSTVWTGATATESKVRSEAAGYSILHFATHGLRDQSKPMHSHIVLAHPSRRRQRRRLSGGLGTDEHGTEREAGGAVGMRDSPRRSG